MSDMMARGELHLERADFPSDPYGYDHGKETAHLCQEAARFMDFSEDEQWLARAIGMFHDLGRKAPWNQPDTDHGRRSAEMFRHVMKDPQNSYWMERQHLVERGAAVIQRHNLVRLDAADHLAVVLWDADLLESARFLQLKDPPRSVVEQRYAKLVTPWGKDAMRQQAHMARRSRPTVSRTTPAGFN